MTVGCSRCERGWVLVSAETAAKMAGPLVVPPDASPEVAEVLAREHDQRLVSAANTAYPCRACNQRAFERWLAGEYASTLSTNGRSSSRPDPAGVPRETPPAGRERRDIDS